MIGRAVEGNPWIFREMNHYFATGEELQRPTLEEIKETILKHARAQIQMKGEFIGIREMRSMWHGIQPECLIVPDFAESPTTSAAMRNYSSCWSGCSKDTAGKEQSLSWKSY